jgi:hypothetical protein
MGEDSFGQRKSRSQQEKGIVNAMEFCNVFADYMRSPCDVTSVKLSTTVPQTSQIICQSVQPYINSLSGVARDSNAPLESVIGSTD